MPTPQLPDELPFELEELQHVCIELALRDAEPAEVQIQLVRNLDRWAPPAPGWADEDTRRGLGLAMARALWRHVPQPRLNFAAAALPVPGRNDVCVCGSGSKYKHCCLPIDATAPDMPLNMLPLLLDALPRERWAELPGSRVSADAVADMAQDWLDAGLEHEVRALLEPWFAAPEDFRVRRELLFDLLLDACTGSGDAVRKQALLDAALEHGDRGLRAGAQQRLATLHADREDMDGAWHWFAEARRTQPDSPHLATLEVTLLAQQSSDAEVRACAGTWLARLQRRRDPMLEPVLDYLRGVSEGADPLMRDIDVPPEGAAELPALFAAAAAPVLRYTLQPEGDSSGPLRPDKALVEPLMRWKGAFPHLSYSITEAGEDDSIWDTADAWLPVLRSELILFDSFEVLHALSLAAEDMGDDGASLRFALAVRGEQLLLPLLEASGASGIGLDWGFRENRPAIRLIEDRVHEVLEQGRPDDATLARLVWLVLTLDRNDHSGLRFALQDEWLARGQFDDVLTLATFYPDDFPAMDYGRALALFAAGRQDEAEAALRQAIEQGPKLIEWLLPEQRAAPELDPRWTTVGGDDEAWQFRCRQRPLWKQHGALRWASSVAGKG